MTIPEGLRTIRSGAFFACGNLESIRVPESVEEIEDPKLEAPFVICLTPFAASHAEYPVYLGGPLSDLPEEERPGAVRGFFYALEHGIREIDPWREAYIQQIREDADTYVSLAEENRTVLLLLTGEELLDEEGARYLMDRFDEEGGIEAKALLLRYCHERFAAGGPGDLSLREDTPLNGI